MYLLEKIMKAEKVAKAGDVTSVYDFELEKRLQCTECKRVKYSSQSEKIL